MFKDFMIFLTQKTKKHYSILLNFAKLSLICSNNHFWFLLGVTPYLNLKCFQIYEYKYSKCFCVCFFFSRLGSESFIL